MTTCTCSLEFHRTNEGRFQKSLVIICLQLFSKQKIVSLVQLLIRDKG